MFHATPVSRGFWGLGQQGTPGDASAAAAASRTLEKVSQARCREQDSQWSETWSMKGFYFYVVW